MGVYIKDMEMPKEGTVIAVYKIDGKLYVTKGLSGKLYPLFSVPPHGRLIDADALGITLEKLAADKWNQKTAPVNWSYAFEECLEIVDNAPTIIEQNFIKAPTIIEADKEDNNG